MLGLNTAWRVGSRVVPAASRGMLAWAVDRAVGSRVVPAASRGMLAWAVDRNGLPPAAGVASDTLLDSSGKVIDWRSPVQNLPDQFPFSNDNNLQACVETAKETMRGKCNAGAYVYVGEGNLPSVLGMLGPFIRVAISVDTAPKVHQLGMWVRELLWSSPTPEEFMVRLAALGEALLGPSLQELEIQKKNFGSSSSSNCHYLRDPHLFERAKQAVGRVPVYRILGDICDPDVAKLVLDILSSFKIRRTLLNMTNVADYLKGDGHEAFPSFLAKALSGKAQVGVIFSSVATRACDRNRKSTSVGPLSVERYGSLAREYYHVAEAVAAAAMDGQG